MSGSQQFSFIIFLVLLLLTLILGESFLRFIILGTWSIYFLTHWKILQFNAIIQHKWVAFSWLVYLLGLLTSSLFTHSIPFTLDFVFFSLTGFIVFWFFVLLPKDYFSQKLFSAGLLVLGVIMTFIGTYFYFSPGLAVNLPGMNLFYSTYGHNHLSAFLLLLFPLSISKLVEQTDRKRKTIYGFIVLLFGLGMIFSFGRIALLLSALEVLVLLFFYRSQKQKIQSRLIVSGFFATILIVAVIYVLFSFLPVIHSNFSCSGILIQIRLCKNIQEEARPLYWLQAFYAFREYFWEGYGPGTFSLISQKYQQSPGIYTGYAHNAFFQHFAETGLVGGMSFLFLIAVLLYKSTLSFFNNRKKDVAILIALLVSALNAGVDFDWSFSGIFLLTLIFGASLLRNVRVEEVTNYASSFVVRTFQVLFLMISTFCISIMIVSAITEILFIRKDYDPVIRFFPYISSQRLFLFTPERSDSQKDKIIRIYFYHSDMQFQFEEYILQRKMLSKEQLASQQFIMNPWNRIFNELSSIEHLKVVDLNESEQYSIYIRFLIDAKQKYGYELSHEQMKKILEQFLLIADAKANKGSIEIAGNDYLLAYQLHPWIINDHKPFFTSQQLTADQISLLIPLLSQIKSDDFGQYSDEYARIYLQFVLEKGSELSEDDRQILLQRILAIAPWKEDEVKNITFE